jgi:hypothetical protein
MTYITPTEHEKREWSRLAHAAYAANLNTIGHRYSGSASLRHDSQMPIDRFDDLQTGYRIWLNNGLDAAFAIIQRTTTRPSHFEAHIRLQPMPRPMWRGITGNMPSGPIMDAR